MLKTTEMNACEYDEKLSRNEIIEILKTQFQKRLGISVKQFFKKYRAGKIDDAAEVADLIVFADLLPESDPIFG